MRIVRWFLLTMLILADYGCSLNEIKDVPKTIWGSSTRVLEEARSDAIVKIYDKDYWDCLRAVFNAVEKKKYVVFKKDEVRGYLVIMGIPGAVNTTEVGVFIVEINDKQTRIELSSLSTHAKRLLAKALFHEMDIEFGLAEPDKEDGLDEQKEDQKK